MKRNALAREKMYIDIIFCVLMLLALALSVWKSKYGFGSNDEPFYLTVPHRLLLGDCFITDEWHLSQLSAFLSYPILKLFVLINGGTQGVVLFFRYAYIFMHLLASVFVYVRLRKYKYGALFASVLYFIFTPYDIMALSYNTMGLDLVTCSGILAATADDGRRVPLAAAGLLFAGAVLCNPYLLLAYLAFFVCAVLGAVLKRFGRTALSDLFKMRSFLLFTLGAAVPAAVFFAFVLSRAGLGELKNALPYLMCDPEHPPQELIAKLSAYFVSMLLCEDNFVLPFAAYTALLIAMLKDSRRKKHRLLYLSLSALVAVFAHGTLRPELLDSSYNYIMFPAIFPGITSYILCENAPKRLFIYNFMLGLIYSLAMCLSSNQYFYVQSMAIASSNISSFIFIYLLVREIAAENAGAASPKRAKIPALLAALSFAAVICVQGGMQLYVKAGHVFAELGPGELDTELSGGPAAGTVTTKYNATVYQNMLADIESCLGDKDGKKVLFLTDKTWTYLAVEDMEYSTFSAWLSGVNDAALGRLNVYYTVNPQKTPEYVYIPNSRAWDLETVEKYFTSDEYSWEKTANGYLLEARR